MTPYEFLVSWTARLTAQSVTLGHDATTTDDLIAVRLAATQWISRGTTLDDALDACRDSGHDVLTNWLSGPSTTTTAASRAVVTLVSKATAAIDDQYRIAAVHARTRSLRFGDNVSGRYSIVTLYLPGADTDHATTAVRRTVDNVCGPDHATRTLIEPTLVTILIPGTAAQPWIDGLVAQLRRAVGRSLLGATVDSAAADLPEAMRFTSDLITLARTLRRPLKLYRTHDLALEYQVARPGYGRNSLESVLDPLRDKPSLLDTVVTYVTTEQNRRTTSRMLYIHPNTLDARLKKISELLGYDIASVAGQRKTEAAVLVQTLQRRFAPMTD